MKYFDVSYFEADKGMQERLGFASIYCAGRDVEITEAAIPSPSGRPTIVMSRNPDTLARALRMPGVAGIIFSGGSFNKKVMERAAESGRIIFIPISGLLWQGMTERQKQIHEIRKAVASMHRLKARAAIITLAQDKESLLSRVQMEEIASMIYKGMGLFGGDILDIEA